MPSWGLSKYVETKLQNTCFFTSYKAYLKNKRRSGTSLSASFCAWFLAKNFILLYSVNWPNFIAWLLLLHEILYNIWIVIVCSPGCDVINIEINLIFLMKPFFLHEQKVKTKRAFIEVNKTIFLEGESPTFNRILFNWFVYKYF